jgi:hypothetical protein
MTKAKSNSSQMSLLDLLKENEIRALPKGSMAIGKEFKEALSDDIRRAKDERGKEISRAQVAARMTDLIGEEVTLSMVNNWTATSHEHELPASFLPAFIQATGGQRSAAEAISRHSGLYLLPGPEALRAEIQRFDEQIKEAQSAKRARLSFLRELNGKEHE